MLPMRPQIQAFRTLVWAASAVLSILAFSDGLYAQELRVSQATPRSAKKLKPPSVPALPGPVIPGLSEGAIPQGLAYAPEQGVLLVSHYFDGKPSCLSVVDVSTGRLQGCATLADKTGQPHSGHVGGVAVQANSVFVASDGHVFQYELEPIVTSRRQATVTPISSWPCETKASYCAATERWLFVGEFAYGKDYPTNSAHHLKDRKGVRKYAWICGYDRDDPMGEPKCVLSVRQRVQGLCVTKDRVFLSLSYGRKNRSQIVVYRSPLEEPSHRTVKTSRGANVPLWFLDGENYLGEIDFPPMSEGIVMIDDRVAVLSESGARKYQVGGKGPMDWIVLLDVSSFPGSASE